MSELNFYLSWTIGQRFWPHTDYYSIYKINVLIIVVLLFDCQVWELTANGVVMVSAIGNDGPLYG